MESRFHLRTEEIRNTDHDFVTFAAWEILGNAEPVRSVAPLCAR